MIYYVFEKDTEYNGNPYDYIVDKIEVINKNSILKNKKMLIPGKDYDVPDITGIVINEKYEKPSIDIYIYFEKMPNF